VDTAAAYDQLAGMAQRARTQALRFENTIGRLTVADGHDLETVNAAAVSLESLMEVADRAESAALSAAIAADLEARYGVPESVEDTADPELERERLRVSAHEGGHAVFCVKYGFPIVDSELDVHRGFFGMGEVNASGFVQTRTKLTTYEQFMNMATMMYAGAESTVRWHLLDGEAPPTARRLGYQGASHDMALAEELLGGDRRALQKAQQQAQKKVAEWWLSIDSVAERFRERDRLSGSQIERAA
jgi:hypothetical protein